MANMFLAPRINPFLSLVIKEPDRAVVSLRGRIKILKCMTSVLEEVLDLVDGKRSLGDITKILSNKYPAKHVNSFLRSLIQAEVIVTGDSTVELDSTSNSCGKDSVQTKAEAHLSVLLIGRGTLADAIRKKLNSELGATKYRFIEFGKTGFEADDIRQYKEKIQHNLQSLLKSFKHDFLIVSPDKCTYGWLIGLNDTCLGLDIPFLFCYYNGNEIVLGPTVIPRKTPCYGCLIEHRRCYMQKKGNVQLCFDDLLPLIEAWPIPQSRFAQSIIEWVASYVVFEAQKLQQTECLPSLIKKQLRVSPSISHHLKQVTFSAITTCPSCSGMNRKLIIFSDKGQLHPPLGKEILLKDRPVVYRQGGYRSVRGKEARKMIDWALDRLDLEINIEKITSGSLDNIIFRYKAKVKARNNKKLPFVIPKYHSRGKGITEEQAYLSATFELFERISSEYYGDIEIIRARYREVKDLAIDLPSHIGQVFHHGVMDHFKEDAPIDWVWGFSLIDHRFKLVPASMVFLTQCKFLGHFFDTASGGLAAGATIEDAILQGLLEIVEHDAWMIWQANAVVTPRIKNDTIQTAYLAQIIKSIEQLGFQVIIRDYTTDFSIPVFKTWIVNHNDYSHYATCGFGANLNPDIAIERSISEACQTMEYGDEKEQLTFRGPLTRDLVFNYYSLYNLYHFNQLEIINMDKELDYSQFYNQATNSVTDDIKKVIALLQNSIPDIDVVVVNLTKEILGIPVVRVIVGGGIQPIAEPILSTSKRLLDLPQKFGYRSEKLTYEELYNGPYPH